ncbi:membrane hypothetical protein [Rhodospirillaceae bacterium LM-1]|nr:membrane hypothetical protein [Rhodospirillaceae bacterium LM-1]
MNGYNNSVWEKIEDRCNIKNIQLAVFGAAIGFMIAYIANDFIIKHLLSLPHGSFFIVVFFFAITLFLYLALGYVCHRGDIKHIKSKFKYNSRNYTISSKKLHHVIVVFVSLLFGAIVLLIFSIASFALFELMVIPFDVLDNNAVKKNRVFMLLVGTIYATWFATSYWINEEFPDPMDELFLAKEAEKSATTPP